MTHRGMTISRAIYQLQNVDKKFILKPLPGGAMQCEIQGDPKFKLHGVYGTIYPSTTWVR